MIRSAFQKASGILKPQISATTIGGPVSPLALVLGRGLKYENTSLGRWLGSFNDGSFLGSCRLLHTGDPTTSNLIRESSPMCTSRLSNLSSEELFKLKSSIERGIPEELPPPALKFASSEGETGGSHISPIGGYHAGRDLVLIMDVACFKYPPHWVPLKLLWKAMETIDEVTGKHKWFMVLSQLAYDPSVLYTLNCRGESWISTVYYLTQLPILLKLEHIKDTLDVLSVVFKSDTPNFEELIKRTAEVNRPQNEITHLSSYEKGRHVVQKELLQQVQETNLFKHVNKWLCAAHCENIASFSGDIEPGKMVQYINGSSGGSRFGKGIRKHLPCVDILTMMLFALPSNTWSGVKEKKLLTELNNLLTVDNAPFLLKNEVLSLRQQLRLLIDLGLPLSSSD